MCRDADKGSIDVRTETDIRTDGCLPVLWHFFVVPFDLYDDIRICRINKLPAKSYCLICCCKDRILGKILEGDNPGVGLIALIVIAEQFLNIIRSRLPTGIEPWLPK